MARNSEKRLSGLNRFLEAKETKKNAELQRPPLSRLTCAEDVKGWIPSIEKEIGYLLRQIEGTGSRKHSDAKITEFQERIDYLKREHKRFVAKVRSLDPSYSDVIPWQPRGYKRKRGKEGGPAMMTEGLEVKKLFSPLLDQEEQAQVASGKPETTSTSQDFHLLPEGIPPPQSYSEWPQEHTATGLSRGLRQSGSYPNESATKGQLPTKSKVGHWATEQTATGLSRGLRQSGSHPNESVTKGQLPAKSKVGHWATEQTATGLMRQIGSQQNESITKGLTLLQSAVDHQQDTESHQNEDVMKEPSLGRGDKGGLLGLNYSSSEEET